MSSDLLTTAQVAEVLNKTVQTINRYVRDGLLTATMQLPGENGARLFHPAEVERFKQWHAEQGRVTA